MYLEQSDPLQVEIDDRCGVRDIQLLVNWNIYTEIQHFERKVFVPNIEVLCISSVYIFHTAQLHVYNTYIILLH
jgi:hypothetical protein